MPDAQARGRRNDQEHRRDTSQERYEGSLDSPEDSDFAGEHDKPTFADEQSGGPEGVKEEESPSGLAGDGGMDPEPPSD